MARLQEENAVLKRRFTGLRSKADQLAEQMQLLIEDDKMLLTLAGLDDVDPDTRLVGAGGPSLEEEDELAKLPEAVRDGGRIAGVRPGSPRASGGVRAG